MAITLFDLDAPSLVDGWFTLLVGDRNAGKTHLIGDFLRTESQLGPVVYINCKGEGGADVLKGMGLGKVFYRIETFADFMELVNMLQGKGIRAMGLDSFPVFSELVAASVIGTSARMPEAKFGREDEKNEWTPYHFKTFRALKLLRTIAPLGMVSASADVSVSNVARTAAGAPKRFGGKVTPNVPGKQAFDSVGYFDMAGYMYAENQGGMMKRYIDFSAHQYVVTRQRLPKEITEEIEIPRDAGGWQKIKDAIEKSFGAPVFSTLGTPPSVNDVLSDGDLKAEPLLLAPGMAGPAPTGVSTASVPPPNAPRGRIRLKKLAVKQ